MERLENISISRIADILSSTNLIVPSKDIWKKIFYNAGMLEKYDMNKRQLETQCKEENWEKVYYHNDRCYSKLFDIFIEIYNELNQFILLFNSICEKILPQQIFGENIERIARLNMDGPIYFDIDDYIWKRGDDSNNKLLKKYASANFSSFRQNLNILNLDITFKNKVLTVTPFTYLSDPEVKEETLVVKWLSLKYPNVAESYDNAKRSWGNSDPVGCLSHCRNVITGVFSYKKAAQTDWVKGLQLFCDKDKNIKAISNPKIIPNIIYNPHDKDMNKKYRYPRFNTIYSVYAYLCALGAHINEGNLKGEVVDAEETDMKDAFMGLRMTEDILIWIYQNEK